MLQKFGSGIVNRNRIPNKKNTCDVLAVASGKGGVGKTTVSVNMAISLQQMNKKVLLVDADIHLGNVDLILGTRTTKTIADVVEDGVELKDIIIKGKAGIDILPASSAAVNLIQREDVVLRKLSAAFERFEHNYDYILLDTGAGIAQTVISFLLGADKIALIITPDPSSIADAYAVIKVVRSVNKTIPIFLTSNMVSSADEGEILFKKMNLMAQKFLDSRLIFGGSILKDDLIGRSVKTQQPFILQHPNSAASNSIRVLNRRLLQAARNSDAKNNNLFDRLIQNKKIQFEWNL